MASSFNPYLKWLGIPLKDQPPNHYRLLGVELFESDPDIIERAADRQMTYLRSLQSGEHAALAQQLLNEISAAKVCLLDPHKKEKYDQKLQVESQESGLRPQSPPQVGSAAGGSGVLSAAPPVRTVAAPPRRTSGSPSGVGLKTAEPLKEKPVARPVAVAAPTIDTTGKSSAAGSAAKPSPAAGATAAPSGPVAMPLLAALGAGGAMLLLLGAIGTYFLWPSSDDRDLAKGGSGQTTTDGGAEIDDRNGASSLNNSKTATSNTGGNNTGIGANNTSGNNSKTGNISTGGNNSTVGGNSTSVRSTGTQLSIEAPFILGTINNGEKVLSDRDHTFANVATELQKLEYTRWAYGAVQSFDFDVERGGPVYLILPPRDYARPLPSVNVPGWEKTALSCDVRLESGATLACMVYRRDASVGSATVPGGAAIWPMVAADTIVKRRRTLSDIVDNGNGNKTGGNTDVPASTGGDDPDDTETVASTGGNTDPIDTGSVTQTPTKPAKLPVPPSDEQQKFQARIVEAFEISKSSSLEQTLADAKRMFEVGREPSENDTERYMILVTAARMAADGGDLDTSLAAVDLIDQAYEADALAMRLYLTSQFVKSRASKNVKANQLQQVARVLDEGLGGDRFDEVEDIVTDLSRDGLSHKELADRRKVAREMKVKYRRVAAARATLEGDPDNAEANRIAGEYAAYHKLNWDDGLPMLAKSDDAALAKVAQLDLDNPEDGKSQFAIAQGWYDLAKSQKDDDQVKGALLTRAEDWYRKALSDVTGLDEVTAKKRLDEIKEDLASIGWVEIPRKAIVAGRSGYEFEMYHNGVQIIDSDYREVGSAAVTLKRGDILFVKARRSTSTFSSSSYTYGFACVIAFEGGAKPLVTGAADGWTGYVTSDNYNWYKPENVVRTVPVQYSSGAGHQDLAAQTGVAARSMWYAAGSTSEAYFFFRVP